jgi:EmrB/QacA subfamily drug resistance transporter
LKGLPMKEKSKWIILTLLALSQFMVVLDSAIANVALPAIQKELGFESAALQWIITAYALTFGGTLLLGGRAADLFGRRKVLVSGIIGFIITSFLIGIAQSPIEMIAFRALQGVAAAFMSPAALSIVLTTFREGTARNRALGVWATVASGGAAVGLVLGGLLTEYLNWRWNFFVNVPLGILTVLGIFKYVPAHSTTAPHRHLDLGGAFLVTAGLMTLVYGLTEAPVWGWFSLPTIGTLLASVALVAGFIWNEKKVPQPLVPLSIFKTRNISGANLMMVPVMASMMGMFFVISLFIQTVLKYDPVVAGASFIIFPVLVGIVSNIIPKFMGKVGFKKFLVIGIALLISGLLTFIGITEHSNYFMHILPGIVLMGTGMGFTFVSATIAATSGVHAEQAGLASGLMNVSQQMGGALGLAVLSGIATEVAKSSQHLGAVGAVVAGNKAAFIGASILATAALLLAIFVIRNNASKNEGATEPVALH